jgi:hypothetical protein
MLGIFFFIRVADLKFSIIVLGAKPPPHPMALPSILIMCPLSPQELSQLCQALYPPRSAAAAPKHEHTNLANQSSSLHVHDILCPVPILLPHLQLLYFLALVSVVIYSWIGHLPIICF